MAAAAEMSDPPLILQIVVSVVFGIVVIGLAGAMFVGLLVHLHFLRDNLANLKRRFRSK